MGRVTKHKDGFLTRAEIRNLTAWSEERLNYEIETKKIVGIKEGGVWYFDESDFAESIKKHQDPVKARSIIERSIDALQSYGYTVFKPTNNNIEQRQKDLLQMLKMLGWSDSMKNATDKDLKEELERRGWEVKAKRTIVEEL